MVPSRTHVLAPRLVVFASALAGLWAAWGPPIRFDDAYISYRYAENLVAGDGPVYNRGEAVEGYTNFLWMLLSAVPIAAGMDPAPFTRALGVAAYLLTIAITGSLLHARTRGKLSHGLVLLPLLLALVLPHGLASVAGAGLESAFVALGVLAMGILHHLDPLRSRWRQAAAAIVPLVALLTRLDAAVFVACSAAVGLAREWRRAGRGRAIAAAVRRFGFAALGLAAYLAWKVHYYGTVIPNSYQAKSAQLWNWAPGAAYLEAFVINSPQVVVLALGCASGLLVCRRRSLDFVLFVLASVVLYALYLAKVGGDFMYYRLAFQAYPLLVAGAGCAAAAWLARQGRRLVVAAWVGVALVLSSAPPHLEHRFGMQSLAEMESYVRWGVAVGRRLREILPHDTRIATGLSGTIPFESKLFTVDEFGLNDRYVARLPDRPISFRGHMKRAPDAYLRSRGVQLVFDRLTVESCRAAPDRKPVTIAIRLAGDRCVPSRYLVQTPELTDHFCRHPEWFVRSGLPCAGASGGGAPAGGRAP